MANYYVNLQNNDSQIWTMAVYQTFPSEPGLDSVSWQQTTVPDSGYSGVSWTIDYDVCLANYQQLGGIGVYTASQILPTALGKAWQVIWQEEGPIGVQELVPDTTTSAPVVPAGSIYVTNNSQRMANIGIGMSGAGTAFENQVEDGAMAQFDVSPTYYAGLFNQVVLGEVIKSNVVVGPFEIQFLNGMNAANLTATRTGDTINVTISYSQQFPTSLDDVNRRLRLQELRQYALPAPAPAAPALETSMSHNGA